MKQKGYTLLELLLVIAITGVIVTAVGSSIVLIMRGEPQMSEKSVSMADIDNAAHWLTQDLVLAQTTTGLPLDGTPVTNPTTSNPVTINWSDLTAWAADAGSVQHSVTYYLSGTQLRRNYDGTETIVGKYLTNVSFSFNGAMFTVTLTSRSGWTGATVTRSFLIQKRSTGA